MAYGISLIAGAAALVLFLLIHTLARPKTSRSADAAFPPGPPGLPLLGNLHQIPLTKSFLAFAEWSRTYGAPSNGILGLRLGPTARAVVLNKWQNVRDLLDARGAIYSSRPVFPLAEFVIPPPGDLHLVFMQYGAKWRRTRRTITEFLKDGEVEKLLPVQDAESTQLIWQLLTDSRDKGKYHDHAMRFFGAVILATVFGLRGKDYGPESRCRRFFAVQDEWAAMLDQGATPPYDVFPFLRHVPDVLTPWRGWRGRAEFLKQRQSSLYQELFAATAERVRQGKSLDCFLAGLIRDQEEKKKAEMKKYTQLELDYIGGFLMEGGADTTAMAFLTFVLAMAAHPEIQRRARNEVDAVFGGGGGDDATMPHDADGTRLPYLKACFLETLRWRPGFPMGVPHATSADDTYRGFVIPKGTAVIMNTWAIQHDPDEYEDPDVFEPARYLANKFGTKKGASSQSKEEDGLDVSNVAAEDDASRKQTYAFGAGRRLCAGQRMAENSMMITMAKLLWAFDVRWPGGGSSSGEGGDKKLDTGVQTAFKDAILTGPKLFDVEFVVRSEKKRAVIETEWASADRFLSRFE